jgi:hypothetical protein
MRCNLTLQTMKQPALILEIVLVVRTICRWRIVTISTNFSTIYFNISGGNANYVPRAQGYTMSGVLIPTILHLQNASCCTVLRISKLYIRRLQLQVRASFATISFSKLCGSNVLLYSNQSFASVCNLSA